jgi:saccharopine dehydrogenase (NAD+, L-lysine-forming)
MNVIGLRKEEKPFETRVPVIPEHVRMLSSQHSVNFVVEPSEQRAFNAHEYQDAKAKVIPLKGSPAQVILGIKEMPGDFFETGKVYIFFSHTIKGQQHNMPMLRSIIDAGATLIDYERIVDDQGKRLVFFGNWAGMAGLSDTLYVLGQRLALEHTRPNPFKAIKRTLDCRDLSELKDAFAALAKHIELEGLPKQICPLIIGFAGYGNVSRGAQELFEILPHKSIEPDELPDAAPDHNLLYKCVFREEHLVEPIDPSAKFDLQDYYNNGKAKYKAVFQRYIPYLTVLMNCIYWSDKYPRLVTKDFVRAHWNSKHRKLRVIGDISCDIEGAIEFTLRATNPAEPAFTYLVKKDRIVSGVSGEGPVVMAIDNLPSELPRESSASFSTSILEYIPSLADADFALPFEELDLRRELKDAVIVYQGSLTKKYEYLRQYLEQSGD